MKFETLYNNLIIEQDETAPSAEDIMPPDVAAASNEFKAPQPQNFQDIKGVENAPIQTEHGQQKLKDLIKRIITMSDEINGLGDEGTEAGGSVSIQQSIYELEGGIYSKISDVVSDEIEKAAGNLLEVANKLRTFVISTDKRALDMSLKR